MDNAKKERLGILRRLLEDGRIRISAGDLPGQAPSDTAAGQLSCLKILLDPYTIEAEERPSTTLARVLCELDERRAGAVDHSAELAELQEWREGKRYTDEQRCCVCGVDLEDHELWDDGQRMLCERHWREHTGKAKPQPLPPTPPEDTKGQSAEWVARSIVGWMEHGSNAESYPESVVLRAAERARIPHQALAQAMHEAGWRRAPDRSVWERGKTIEADPATLAFEAAERAETKPPQIQTSDGPCPDCKGSGQYVGLGMYATTPCQRCGGSGRV